MLIFATRYSRAVKTCPRYVRKRSYNNFDPKAFVSAVQQLNWLDLYLCDDADVAVRLLSSKITFILDAVAPMRTIQVRTRYAPWLSSTTIQLMKERDSQQKLASENNSRDEWIKFKSL